MIETLIETLKIKIESLEKMREEDRHRHHHALDSLQVRVEMFDKNQEDNHKETMKVINEILRQATKTNGRVDRLEIDQKQFVTKDSYNPHNKLFWQIISFVLISLITAFFTILITTK